MMEFYKIVGIVQVYNEIRKGNLERFIKHITPIVHSLVVYDDGSTDGSYEFVKKYTEYVIRGVKNDFQDEVAHRQILIMEALKLSPDFILWLDADEVMTANAKEKLPEICRYCIEKDLDGISFHELNLWRSYTWRRLDSLYDDGWFPRLWKVNAKIGDYKEIKRGLHQQNLIPPSIKKIEKIEEVGVIHYGFASERTLAYKYLTYKSHGQSGYVMLDRLIDEKLLALERIPREYFPTDLWAENDQKPESLTFEKSLTFVEKYRNEVLKPAFSIICVAHKSTKLVRFIYEQIIKYTDLSNAEFFFVANDTEPEIINYLRKKYIPHVVFETPIMQKQERHINNVYRAYNYGAQKAQGDFLVLINSDMAFTPGWMDKLWKSYNGQNCISSRVVEASRLRSDQYIIKQNFGDMPGNYNEYDFLDSVEQIKEPIIKDGGLYIPLLLNKDDFLYVHGYPEGNIIPESDIFAPEIAPKGEPAISGDLVLIKKLESRGVYHQTALDSVVYHFQVEDMRDDSGKKDENNYELVAVCSNLLAGSMGRQAFWDRLIESLPSVVKVNDKYVEEKEGYAKRAYRYLKKYYPNLPLIIQNATFIGTVDPDRYTIMFLQDNLRAMERPSEQQETNLRLARKLVTNSITIAASYPEFDFELIPVGADDKLFQPMDKGLVRKEFDFGNERIGIFVGSFSEAKGWPQICECIEKFRDITWIVVSKYDETYNAPNVRFFNKLPQNKLAKLLNCADFFIAGYPEGTQCLTAIEACLCNIPIITKNIEAFADFNDDERSKVGIFGNDFMTAIQNIPNSTFSPRQVVLNKHLTISASMEKWNLLVTKALFEISSEKYGYKAPHHMRLLRPTEYRRWRYPLLSKILEKIKMIVQKIYNFLRKVYILRLTKQTVSSIFKIFKKYD